MAVLLAQVADVSAGRLEDPQPQQAEHGYQREIVRVGRLAGGSQHRLDLQVGESDRGRLGRDRGPADMLGR